jgi:rhodanese-related sulfurtransferase
MPFTQEQIETNRKVFAEKLSAFKALHSVVQMVKGEKPAEFLLLDARPREAFAKAHIPGALCVPAQEVAELASKLPREKELVTYCWNFT